MKYLKTIAVFVLVAAILAIVLNLGSRIINNVHVAASAKAAEAKVQEVMGNIAQEPSFNCDESIYRIGVCLDQYPTREGEECIYGFDSLWQAIRYTEFIEAFIQSVDGHQEELGINWATKTNYEANHDEFMEAYCDLMWKSIGKGTLNKDSLVHFMSRSSIEIKRRGATKTYQFHYYNDELDRTIYLPVAYVEYIHAYSYDGKVYESGMAAVQVFDPKTATSTSPAES